MWPVGPCAQHPAAKVGSAAQPRASGPAATRHRWTTDVELALECNDLRAAAFAMLEALDDIDARIRTIEGGAE
jgi:hypothetical protein